MRRILALSSTCLVVVLLLSCSSGPDVMIIGKWQEPKGGETIEFLKDKTFQGTLIWDMTKTPVDISGTYSVEGSVAKLVLQKPTALAPMILKVEFSQSGKEMTINYQQGGAIKLDGTVLKYQKQG